MAPIRIGKKELKARFPHLRILGDFSELPIAQMTEMEKARLSVKELKDLKNAESAEFAESRLYGLDGSVKPFGIGGSDVGTIFDVNSFSCASQLYEQKRYPEIYLNRPLDERKKKTFAAGHRAEPIIRAMFEELTEYRTFECDCQVVNPKWPHCIANIDGLVIDHTNEIGIYEGKWSNSPVMIRRYWGKLRNIFNSTRTLGDISNVPMSYVLQCYFYMAVYELNYAYICGGWGFHEDEIGWTKIDRLPPDEEDYFMSVCEEFVMNSAAKIRPSDIGFRNKVKLYNDIYKEFHKTFNVSEKAVKLPDECQEIIETIMELEKKETDIKNKIKAATDEINNEENYNQLEQDLCSAKAALAELLYENEEGILEIDGKEYHVTYKGDMKFKFDKTTCQNDYPEIFDKVYYKQMNARSIKVFERKD